MKAYESIRDYLALDSQIHEFYKVVQEDPILPYLPNSAYLTAFCLSVAVANKAAQIPQTISQINF